MAGRAPMPYRQGDDFTLINTHKGEGGGIYERAASMKAFIICGEQAQRAANHEGPPKLEDFLAGNKMVAGTRNTDITISTPNKCIIGAEHDESGHMTSDDVIDKYNGFVSAASTSCLQDGPVPLSSHHKDIHLMNMLSGFQDTSILFKTSILKGQNDAILTNELQSNMGRGSQMSPKETTMANQIMEQCQYSTWLAHGHGRTTMRSTQASTYGSMRNKEHLQLAFDHTHSKTYGTHERMPDSVVDFATANYASLPQQSSPSLIQLMQANPNWSSYMDYMSSHDDLGKEIQYQSTRAVPSLVAGAHGEITVTADATGNGTACGGDSEETLNEHRETAMQVGSASAELRVGSASEDGGSEETVNGDAKVYRFSNPSFHPLQLWHHRGSAASSDNDDNQETRKGNKIINGTDAQGDILARGTLEYNSTGHGRELAVGAKSTEVQQSDACMDKNPSHSHIANHGNPNITSTARKSAETFGQRSSIYRGVTKHRWTGRFEAHLWDNSCKREGQTRKGRQVYLGGYDLEDKAARAYDLAALKYWGPTTTINYPLENYKKELEDMRSMTKQEFVASLRRKSSGFSRGASQYRGVTRHHQHGRWQARIGRVAGNKDLYLGTFTSQEEAAEAYDIAAIKFRGINAVTNFDLSRYDIEKICSGTSLPIQALRRAKDNGAAELMHIGFPKTVTDERSDNTHQLVNSGNGSSHNTARQWLLTGPYTQPPVLALHNTCHNESSLLIWNSMHHQRANLAPNTGFLLDQNDEHKGSLLVAANSLHMIEAQKPIDRLSMQVRRLPNSERPLLMTTELLDRRPHGSHLSVCQPTESSSSVCAQVHLPDNGRSLQQASQCDGELSTRQGGEVQEFGSLVKFNYSNEKSNLDTAEGVIQISSKVVPWRLVQGGMNPLLFDPSAAGASTALSWSSRAAAHQMEMTHTVAMANSPSQ